MGDEEKRGEEGVVRRGREGSSGGYQRREKGRDGGRVG